MTSTTTIDDLIRAVETTGPGDLERLDAEIASREQTLTMLRRLRTVFEPGDVTAGAATAPPPPRSGKTRGERKARGQGAARKRKAARSGFLPRITAGETSTSLAMTPTAERGGKTAEYRRKVIKYLDHAGLPVRPAVLAVDCGVPEGSMSMVVDHPHLERTPAGIRLTDEGRAEAKRNRDNP